MTDLDISDSKGATVYWVLGFLNESLGRRVVADDDLVETLYCNERDRAVPFRTLLGRLVAEQGLRTELREVIVQDCLVEFRSVEISRAINSMYVARSVTGWRTLEGNDLIELRSGEEMFHGVGRNERLAYLGGVYQRYGADRAIVFTNAQHKADLVADLLRQLGAAGVERETTQGFTPQANTVRFVASPELVTWFSKEQP